MTTDYFMIIMRITPLFQYLLCNSFITLSNYFNLTLCMEFSMNQYAPLCQGRLGKEVKNNKYCKCL